MHELEERLRRNLESVRSRIAAACGRSGRSPGDVKLVAVTKMVGLEEARAIASLGVTDLGENRVEEGLVKMEAMGQLAPGLRWHMIGHLQSRKARDAVGRFALIHSVDSLKLLGELEKRSQAAGVTTDILAEINVSGEEAKFGLSPEELEGFCRAASGCARVRLCGLMTMAPLVGKAEDFRGIFRSLRQLRDGMNAAGACRAPLAELSMGMTNDFEVAVEEGASIVRIGTALFA